VTGCPVLGPGGLASRRRRGERRGRETACGDRRVRG
jgi:hypothetical protein